MGSRRRTLYETIYQEVLSAIQSGEIRAGDRLGTEAEIAARYGVSRITSKRAMDQLAREGVIERRPGRGSFVREPSASAEPHLVGVVIPELSPTYGTRLLASLADGLAAHGFDMAVALSHGDQAIESEAVGRFRAHAVKGFVIFPVNGEYHNAAILRLHLDRVPLVLVDKPLARVNVAAVWSNNEAAGYDATRHLIDLGHRRIGFLSSPMAHTETLEDRYRGYRRALQEAGIEYAPGLVAESLPTERLDATEDDGGYATIAEFLRAHGDCTALVATEYRIGLETIQAARSLGWPVPDRMSLVTFDGPFPVDPSTQITHIRQDERAMGQEAVRLLLEQLQGGQSQAARVEIPAHLVPGVTTGPVAMCPSLSCGPV